MCAPAQLDRGILIMATPLMCDNPQPHAAHNWGAGGMYACKGR